MTEWRVPGLIEVRELGVGGQGRVVLAHRDGDAGEALAVKYLAPALLKNASAREIFRAEARLLERVDDTHVARLHAFVEGEGGAAIVMEAVNGVSLRLLLDERGTLEPEAALSVLKGALLGLGAAHRVGVVHRDFKPANVMVEEDGNSKLIDFGIAVLAGQGGRSGTPAYMAPEQWRGEPASPATDVYAATCVFFECVTGTRPFEGKGLAALRLQHTTQPPPLDEVPDPVRELVARGLTKNPGRRLWDVFEFVSELETLAVGAYGKDWERRGRGALAASAAALTGGLSAAAVAASESGGFLSELGVWHLIGGVAAAGTTAAVVVAALLWPSDPSIKHAWTTQGIRPASPPMAVDGGFALYTSDGRGGFQIVGLDGEKGRVRWRHPATPSGIIRGVGLYPAAKGRTVVYMSPVGTPRDRRASIVAIDATTGDTRWSYGTGGFKVESQPTLCAKDTKVCLTEVVAGGARQRVLNLADGRLLATSALVDGRRLGAEDDTGGDLMTSADEKDLMLVPSSGPVRWRRSLTEIFKTKVSPDFGWWLEQKDGRYVGQIGRTDSADFATGTSYLDRSTVAAFDAATGRPLWTDRGSSVFCGELVYELDHPVRCRTEGVMKKGRRQGAVSVTVEGFDPATGAARWSLNAGDVPGLIEAGRTGVIRLSDTEYLVRTATRGTLVVDLDSGPRPLEGGAPTGWCKDITTVPGVPGARFPAGPNEYAHQAFWPCTIDRKPVRLPRLAPRFSGFRSGKIFAWVDGTSVHAVHVR
jgi:outer membrane protein assembly factor BamB